MMRNQMRPLVIRQLSQFDGMTEDDVWQQLGMQEDGTGARDPALTALMLAETQGLANVLQAMAWTAGEVVGVRPLYTSDNPVARFLTPVRPWWELGGFYAWNYYLAL